MLADLDLLQPHPPAGGVSHEPCHMLEDHMSHGLAANGWDNSQSDKTVLIQLLEPFDLRVILRYKEPVVEHLMQPRLDRLEAAEIEAPIVLIKFVGHEDELERQGIAVD